jgi:hypothetical protein
VNVLLIASAIGVAAIIGLALVLPCPACKRRRERLRVALSDLRRKKDQSVM